MQLPHPTTAAETLVDEYGLYHLTRLRADKALGEMADAFEKVQANLRARIAAHKAAQAATMAAMAVRDGADVALDDAVRAFGLEVLKRANNNRKAPFYLNYFPEGWTGIVGAPLPAEIQKAGVLLSKLAQDTDEGLAAAAQPIRAAVEALTAAIATHKATLEAELQAYGLVQMEKINWFDAYKLDHRTLSLSFYKDPRKADSFFKPPARRKNAVAPNVTPQVPQA